MAEQLNQESEPGVQKVSQSLSKDKLNSLFRQLTHDIRVPVTGLKMLWPMIDDVEPDERAEIYEYLKSSSYELFELIENLALVLSDYELLNEPLESLIPEELITAVIVEDTSTMDPLAEDLPTQSLVLNKKHLKSCLKLSLELCSQMIEGNTSSEIHIMGTLVNGEMRLKAIGPTIAVEGDKYSTRLQYSLFTQAKGNSRLSGFTLLRLKNLMNMIKGKLNVEITKEHTELEMRFPVV